MDVSSVLIPFVEIFDVEPRSQRGWRYNSPHNIQASRSSPSLSAENQGSVFLFWSSKKKGSNQKYSSTAACRCIKFERNAVLRRLQWVLRPLSLRLLVINPVTADLAARARVLPPCGFRNEPLANPAAVVLYFTLHQNTSSHH
jgi:hypothetical protein